MKHPAMLALLTRRRSTHRFIQSLALNPQTRILLKIQANKTLIHAQVSTRTVRETYG